MPARRKSYGACQFFDPTIANNAATPNRPAYLGNQIPVSEVNPYSLCLCQRRLHAGADRDSGNRAVPRANRRSPTPPGTTYNYTGRIDQHIGTKDFIFFRYAGFQDTIRSARARCRRCSAPR